MGRHASRVVVLVLTGLLSGLATANDVEPRLYSNVPVGTNFLGVSYARSSGEVTFDDSVPVADVEGDIDAVLLSYSRGLDIAGKSALLTVAVPYLDVELQGVYLGIPVSGQRQGFGDPLVRLGINLYGAPAMTRDAFAGWRQRTIVGASLSIGMPFGRYLDDRVINTGTHRWNFVGQVGVSHRLGAWTLEAAGGVAWSTDNNDVLEDNRLELEPLYLFRTSVQYHFRPGFWIGAGAMYAQGGQTELNGVRRDDAQERWRTGVAVSYALTRQYNLQLRYTDGIRSRVGADFRTLGVALTYTF